MKHPVDWQTHHTDLYPFETDVSLADIRRVPEGTGACFQFISAQPEFSHFLIKVNDRESVSHDGKLQLLVDNIESPEPIHYRIAVSAVDKDGHQSNPRNLTLGYYSKQSYARSNLSMKSQLIVQQCDMIPMPTRVEDWTPEPLPSEDVEYARDRWSRLLAEAQSDYDKASALARSLVDDIFPHRGTPSDAMNGLTGIGQYKRIIEGKDHAWCANLAAIFLHAGTALNIPMRSIGMTHIMDNGPDYTFRIAEGHATTEVFLRDRNHWIWIDLTFHCMATHIGEVGPLNLFEFCAMLNNPARRPYLFVDEYIVSDRATKRSSVETSPNRDAYIRFFKPEQRLCYESR